ncbi:hypothetical protein CVS40_8407 [Lucilia cuprina]|nr:hypothetical protein CVS40_8407 [Lucilia cuprina]
MQLNCHFTSCKWHGPQNDIFDHFESKHKKFLREPKGKLYFDLNFNDLQKEALILCSPNGLYYFKQNLQQSRGDGIDFGVFHIGESEQVEYKLKLGLKREGYCEYWGPFHSQSDQIKYPDKSAFKLQFDFNYLEILNDIITSRRLRLYFGEFDDSEDKISAEPQHTEWTEKDDHLNRLCIERFTCAICFEYIRRDARFCENKHFICLDCFDQMLQRKKLKCPTCRGHYLYDCVDHDVESLLRMINWPDMDETEEVSEMAEFFKSKPKMEFITIKSGENVS